MDEAPAKTAPAEELLINAPSGDDSVPTKGKIERAGESRGSTFGSPLRNGIPPKRPVSSSQRTITPTPSSATKSTAASAGRSTLGSGFSKPPARPLANSSGRRPLNGVNLANSANSTHRSRPSISSTEEAKRDHVLSEGENKKLAASAPAKRTTLASTTATRAGGPKTAFPNSARRSTLGDSMNLDRKVPTGTDIHASPTKIGPRATVPSTRTPGVSNTPRSSRPPPSSSKRIHGTATSDQLKKRLSTIPASPSHPTSDSTDVDKPVPESRRKSIRPGLGTRKSTLSVTIEQRLREMELVNQMLKAAMAEEGEEEDEAKEEYGKRMDENLASLRLQLEEARRNEGKVPVDGCNPTVRGDHPDELAGSKDVNNEHIEENEGLKTALLTSKEKILELEKKLTAMRTEILGFQHKAEKASMEAQQQIDDIRRKHAEEIEQLSIKHAGKIESLRTTMAEAETEHKRLANNLYKEQEDKINRILTTNQTELEAVRAELAESRKEQARLTAQSHEDLQEVKSAALDQTSREIADLRDQLRSEKDASTRRMKETEERFEDKLQDMLSSSREKEEKNHRFERELQEIQLVHTQELEQAKSLASKNKSRLEDEISKLEERIAEMESKANADIDAHARLLQGKKLEISDLRRTIERLQDEVENLHQTNESELKDAASELKGRNVEISRLRLEVGTLKGDLQEKELEILETHSVIDKLQDEVQHSHQTRESELHNVEHKLKQEHETTMSKLRASHESDIVELREAALEDLADARADYDHKIEQLHQEHQKVQDENAVNLSELRNAKDDLQQLLLTVEAEIGVARASKEGLEKSLKDATNEISTLKTVLETVDKGSEEKDQQHVSEIRKLRDELETTVKRLTEQSTESSSILNSHAKAVQALRETHAKELAVLSATHTEKSDKAMKELQTNYYELLEIWKEAEQSHPLAIDAMKTEHSNAIENAQASYAEEIRALKDLLESKHSQEKRDIEIEHAEKTTALEERQLEEIEELQKQHETSVSAREAAHRVELSKLESQVTQSRKDLVDREHDFETRREEQNKAHRSDQDASELQLKELKDQFIQSQSEKATMKLELETLRQKKLEAEELREQYSAKENETRSLLAQDKIKIAELKAEIEKSRTKALDASKVDVLKQEVTEPKSLDANEVAEMQENLTIEDENREKERNADAEAEVQKKSSAEISELEQVRKELLNFKQEAEIFQEKAELTQREVEKVQLEYEQALCVSQDKSARERDLLAQVETLQTEVDELRKNSLISRGHSKSSSSLSLEVNEPQTDPDHERKDTDSLKKQLAIEKKNIEKLEEELEHALADVERQATKKRELEAALKVTTAQLTEAQTMREDGRNFTSPTPRTPLRTSRWPSTNETQDGADDGSGELEGEDLGSHIEGTMAKLQVTFKQLGEDVNETFLDEHRRFHQILSTAASSRDIESEDSSRGLRDPKGE